MVQAIHGTALVWYQTSMARNWMMTKLHGSIFVQEVGKIFQPKISVSFRVPGMESANSLGSVRNHTATTSLTRPFCVLPTC